MKPLHVLALAGAVVLPAALAAGLVPSLPAPAPARGAAQAMPMDMSMDRASGASPQAPAVAAGMAGAPGMPGMAMAGGDAAASGGSPDAGPPGIDAALRGLQRLGGISITKRADFNAAHGVRGGNGTPGDPFVLADFYAPSLAIRNVSAAYVVRHVFVAGTLELAWTGPGATVEDSRVGFLDVNPNQRHTAPATWFDVRGNAIGAARLRHAGGAFSGNDVGPDGPASQEPLSLEVQGYDGLLVANNTVRGPVEFRLHGHHFSDSFADAWMPMDMMGGSAENRYHALRVEGNRFLDPSGRGVAISDRAHAANDRTAASEPDPALNGTHRHFLDVQFVGNLVQGAGIVVEQPDAPDPHHEQGGVTSITLRDNTVEDPLGGVGIVMRDARNTTLLLDSNVIRFSQPGVAGSAGVLLLRVHGGNATVTGGVMSNLAVGVRGEGIAAGSPWTVAGVAFDHVDKPVQSDRSDRTQPAWSP